jgi:hypothetical protein
MTRIVIALNPPRRMNDFLVYAKAIAARLSEDPIFTPPPPSLAGLEEGLVALESALVASTTRAAGLAVARKACEAQAMQGLQQLQRYVQNMADQAPAAEAAAIIERAGMSVKDVAGPSKATFVVKAGRVTGSAHAYARAAKTRASFDWQLSSDGERWVSIASTVRADATFDELTAGTLYWFRYRTVTKEGTSDWSEPVSLLVV